MSIWVAYYLGVGYIVGRLVHLTARFKGMAKFRLTRKAIVFIVIISSVLLGGGVGYIFWRINQAEQVSPEDSLAGGCQCKEEDEGCPSDLPAKIRNDGCDSGWACCGGQEDACAMCAEEGQVDTGNDCAVCTKRSDGKLCWGTPPGCAPDPDPDPGPGDGEVGQYCSGSSADEAYGCADVVCIYPEVTYCRNNKCECLTWEEQSGLPAGCTGPPVCGPIPSCPSGQVPCSPGEAGCSQAGTVSCVCPGCNNPSHKPYYCKSSDDDDFGPDNVCETGGLDRPTAGTAVNPGQSVLISGWAWDPDGVTNFQLSISGVVQSVSPTTSPANRGGHADAVAWSYQWTVPATASDGAQYDILVTWTDGLGVGGVNCSGSTNVVIQDAPVALACEDPCTTEGEVCTADNTQCITISTGAFAGQMRCVDPDNYTDDTIDQAYFDRACTWEQVNPAWDIEKDSTVVCIDEYTENVRARVDYFLSVTNVQGGGTLDHVVDRPVGIRYEWLIADSINLGGVAIRSTTNSDMLGEVRWELSGSDAQFTEGQTKSNFLTYALEIPRQYFGTFLNTATGYPGSSDDDGFSITHQTYVDCDLPPTGLFDSTESKIVLGTLLLILGIVYATVGNSLVTAPFLIVKSVVGGRDWAGGDRKLKRNKLQLAKARRLFERKVTEEDK